MYNVFPFEGVMLERSPDMGQNGPEGQCWHINGPNMGSRGYVKIIKVDIW